MKNGELPEKLNGDNRSNDSDFSDDWDEGVGIKRLLQRASMFKQKIAGLLRISKKLDTEQSQKKAIDEAFEEELKKSGGYDKLVQVGIDPSAKNTEYGTLFHNALYSKYGQWPISMYDDLMSEMMLDAMGRIRGVSLPENFLEVRKDALANAETQEQKDLLWRKWVIAVALFTVTRTLEELRRKWRHITVNPKEKEDSVEEFFGEKAWQAQHDDPKWKDIVKEFNVWLKPKVDKRTWLSFGLWMQGYKWTEIAETLGISPSTVSLFVKPELVRQLVEYAHATEDEDLMSLIQTQEKEVATASRKQVIASVIVKYLTSQPRRIT